MVTVEAESCSHLADVAVRRVALEVGSHIDAVAGARAVLDIGQTDAGHDAVAQCDVGELLVLVFLFVVGSSSRSLNVGLGLLGGVIGLDLGLSSGRCLLCIVRRRGRVGLSRLGGGSRSFCRSLGLQGSLRVQGDDDMIIAGGVRSGLGPLGQRGDAEQGDEKQGRDRQTCKTLVHGRRVLS